MSHDPEGGQIALDDDDHQNVPPNYNQIGVLRFKTISSGISHFTQENAFPFQLSILRRWFHV